MVAMAASDHLAVDVGQAEALRTQVAKGDVQALRTAAKQFEALIVAQMLKTMRETRFVEEEDDPFGGNSMKLYQELLDQQWAKRMSEGRGLGYAEMLGKALEKYAVPPPEQGGTEAAPAMAKPIQPPARSAHPNLSTQAPAASPAETQVSVSADRAEQRSRAFLDSLRPQAEAAASSTGVPADFILAHAALESGWGSREIRTADGQASHNLFGIKSGRGWQGAQVETATTEYLRNQPLRMQQGFRAYADYTQAFDDYARLLNARYGDAVAAGSDARAFAQGLAAGGYATDPAYAQKLESVIHRVAVMGN